MGREAFDNCLLRIAFQLIIRLQIFMQVHTFRSKFKEVRLNLGIASPPKYHYLAIMIWIFCIVFEIMPTL